MRALLVRNYGPLHNLTLENLPDPRPGPEEVLIDVQAASVNFPDLLVIGGTYQNLPPLPFVPGKDIAGTVATVGTKVSSFKEGERIMAQVEYGAYAERAAVRALNCHRMPAGMSYAEGAAMGLTYLTAYFALVERGGVQAGEVVLVTGAAGGVGSATVQLAKAFGATVLAAVSDERKAAVASSSGADHIIRTDVPVIRESLRQQVFDAVGKQGAHLIIDSVGGDVFDASLRAIAWCGRLVTVGYASGRVPEVRAGLLLVKNISLIGLQVSDYRDRAPEKVGQAQRELFRLYEAGKLKPHIMASYPLDRYREALEQVAARKVLGKVLLAIRPQ